MTSEAACSLSLASAQRPVSHRGTKGAMNVLHSAAIGSAGSQHNRASVVACSAAFDVCSPVPPLPKSSSLVITLTTFTGSPAQATQHTGCKHRGTLGFHCFEALCLRCQSPLATLLPIPVEVEALKVASLHMQHKVATLITKKNASTQNMNMNTPFRLFLRTVLPSSSAAARTMACLQS